MESLEKVMEKANSTFDKDMDDNQNIQESYRTAFLLGWLKSAYEQLYDKYMLEK